jgi:hypothetical protein
MVEVTSKSQSVVYSSMTMTSSAVLQLNILFAYCNQQAWLSVARKTWGSVASNTYKITLLSLSH